jgi:hypothetical protein
MPAFAGRTLYITYPGLAAARLVKGIHFLSEVQMLPASAAILRTSTSLVESDANVQAVVYGSGILWLLE